jgi:hypothetical protein
MTVSTPPGGTGMPHDDVVAYPGASAYRVAANEETTVLTPVSTGTSPIDRIPLSHKKRWIILTSILGVLLAVMIGFTIYLWDVSKDWEAQVGEITAVSEDLGSRLAAEQAEVVRQQEQIDVISEQLSTAQQRITELADLNAQTGDDVQFYVQEINRQRELATTGAAVAAALERCIEGHEQLVIYLRNEDNYDPAELAAYEASLNTLCTNAMAANATFQQAVTK